MPNLWDLCTFLCRLIAGAGGERKTVPERRSAPLQLEALEKRKVLSAPPWATGQSPSVYLALQNLAQAASVPTTNYAPSLLNLLNSIATSLPATSSYLSSARTYLTGTYGPLLGAQYSQLMLQSTEWFILNVEGATINALHAEGVFQDPMLSADISAINVFMFNPFNYA